MAGRHSTGAPKPRPRLFDSSCKPPQALTECATSAERRAAANGRHDVVIALLERGADVHAKCKYVGQTALHFASRWGHGGTVAVLLERGASAGEKDAFGKTPLEMAKAGGHGHVYSALGG
mmetsp:Transcript_34710/g.81380  ORF Transcript_34710/g.81380 Transcript_34710/m.81380 type:complete len:120 (-) Transcript_34710:153-512(-)|eukprot:CAMPEP_0172052544 /NCGR_PEP_ID=MMETSP1043-20130122/3716_1 /TAXON_ID=464988 /ORGANISM="Hemiselmis andersenii, Strain CCMP441" /LENGTH=119 /DNA_ID=CAMNT_0012711707 /DNA_START=435 /DNA_END=794 /DNA_ORIENTATION=+